MSLTQLCTLTIRVEESDIDRQGNVENVAFVRIV
jgi:hypothetical protein